MKKLILLVHGLGGSAEGTWVAFPELIASDVELSAQYDVRSFQYVTSMFGSAPSLQSCADALKTEIETRYKGYSSIAIVAHSQGGLIARWHIAERINSGRPLLVDRLLTFATPHHGAGGASVLSWIPGASSQTKALDPNSEFMRALGLAWAQSKAEQKVATKYVVAERDWVVGPVSATGSAPIDAAVARAVGHIGVVKPGSEVDASFLIAKAFLLDQSWRPSGVESDWRPPVLRFKQLPLTEAARFIYGARALPFIGREAELKTIDAFLGDQNAPFRWMLLYGSGGVGKSRLAMELCLLARNDWHAGFLDDSAREPDWTLWRPMTPTLIVIDYASRDAARVKRIVGALASRNAADGDIRRLDTPVRIILLERTIGGPWLDTIISADPRVKAARAQDLPLQAVTDPWPFFEHVLGKANKQLPDRTKTLAALGEIDSERRPLFAHFMADAIAAGRDIRELDAERLLEDVIERARTHFWRPLDCNAKEERVLALATIASGVPAEAIAALPAPFAFDWDIDRHPALYNAMTGLPASDGVPPLLPDIVGEHFALKRLAEPALSDTLRAKLLDAAWVLGPLGTAQFSLRSHRDLPASAMLSWLRRPPAAAGMAQLLWSLVGVNLVVDLGEPDPVAARALLDAMRAVAEKRDEAALWEHWASAAFNLSNDLRGRDPVAARALLDDMRAVAEKRDEAALWEQWASAATNLMVDLRGRNPVAARDLLDAMRAVAEKRDEAALWEPWAKAAFNLSNDLGGRDPVAARDLLDAMRAVAEKRDEAALWEPWASAAFNLSNDLRGPDPVAARDLLDDMRAVAEKRDEAALWEPWAKAATNLMVDLGGPDPVAARALLDDMRAVAEKRDEAALWEPWAKAATNLMVDLGGPDPVAARALLDAMRAVAEKRDEAALWEQWASAATNLMVDLRGRNPVAARDLLDAMRAVAEKRDEAALWEPWAKAAFNLSNDLGGRDPVAARDLLDAMRAVAEKRDEAALWEPWASAAFNLSNDLGGRDPVAARDLLDAMRAVAEKRDEAALWEPWASAAFNLMVDLGGRDPVAARALLDAMRAVAEKRDEAAQWEPWAKAAANLMVDLGGRDPVAARDLLDAMRAVAEKRDEAALWEQWAFATFVMALSVKDRDPREAQSILQELEILPEAIRASVLERIKEMTREAGTGDV